MRQLLGTAMLFAVCATAATAASGSDTAALEQQARELVAAFAGQLKPTLKQALEQGGPVHAISVCADEAPRIAATLSAESGWAVRRVSLQPRNTGNAQADDWERARLEEFDRQAAAGSAPGTLHASTVVDGSFRYLQAQGVEGVCLLCHGDNISPAVQAALTEYYPDDSATGYAPGQVRGAISLTRKP